MEAYDEKALKSKFGNKLPHDKRYLYDAILRSMRDYRSKNSYSAQIREMILDAKYLFERELYEQCSTRLEHAKEMAIELDEQTALLEILKEERRLLLDLRKPHFEIKLKEYSSESESVVAKIKEELFYQNLYETLITDVVKYLELKDEKDKVELKTKFESVLLQSTPPASNRALRRFSQCLALYHQLLGDYENVFNFYSKVVEWWENNPKYREEEFYRYIVDTSNLLHAYGSKNKFDLLPGLLNKMENSSPKNRHDKGIVFQKVAIYKLIYHINTGNLKGVDALIEDIEKGLTQFTISKNSRLAILSNVAILLFMINESEQCAAWCQRIFKKEKTENRKDVQGFSCLLYLIAIADMDDSEQTEKSIRTVRRFLKKLDLTSNDMFAKETISFISSLNNAPLDEVKPLHQSFKTYLTDLKSTGQKVPFGMDEILLYWVRSKLEKKSIKQLLGWE
jgi:hypothetical protein